MSSSEAILGLIEDIDESLGGSLPFKYEHINDIKAGASFNVEGKEYMVFFQLMNDELTWTVNFVDRKFSTEITGAGDPFKVFSTVLATIREFIKDYGPKRITMSASKSKGESRSSLYSRMLKKYAKSEGYSFEEKSFSDVSNFIMTKVD